MYYSDYLKLGDVLNAQELESDKQGQHAHDEMLFIVIHQSYELWFKQILFEMKSVYDILAKENINDNSPELQIAVNRMHRVTEILRILVDQINILETMSAQDFLDFRDMLRPASGFQSAQYRKIEICATDFFNLVDKDVRPTIDAITTPIEEMFQNIYYF
jgi:tryptophan 2,3-dioxygenase